MKTLDEWFMRGKFRKLLDILKKKIKNQKDPRWKKVHDAIFYIK